MTNPRPITVITGASAGIGLALARVFARHGHELALVARREERLNALADEIGSTGARRPVVIAADLLKPGVRGGLLNVGSMAGFLPGPGMAVYYATKAYVLSFTEALHSELKPRGIRVSVLCPGPVPTEFGDRAGLSKRSMQGPLSQSADYVAEAGYRGLMQGRRTIVPGAINKLITFFIRIISRRLILAFVDHRLRRRRSVGSA
jgi:short-subunit dehydrogenase